MTHLLDQVVPLTRMATQGDPREGVAYLTRALGILRQLQEEGRLPPDRVAWLEAMQQMLE